MPAPVLIRNAAWAVLWDAGAQQHAYARDMDVLLREGRIARIAKHDPNARPPEGAEIVEARHDHQLPA